MIIEVLLFLRKGTTKFAKMQILSKKSFRGYEVRGYYDFFNVMTVISAGTPTRTGKVQPMPVLI